MSGRRPGKAHRVVASAAPYLGNESWGQPERPAEGGKERGGTVTKSQTREEHADAQPEVPADARRGAGGFTVTQAASGQGAPRPSPGLSARAVLRCASDPKHGASF